MWITRHDRYILAAMLYTVDTYIHVQHIIEAEHADQALEQAQFAVEDNMPPVGWDIDRVEVRPGTPL